MYGDCWLNFSYSIKPKLFHRPLVNEIIGWHFFLDKHMLLFFEKLSSFFFAILLLLLVFFFSSKFWNIWHMTLWWTQARLSESIRVDIAGIKWSCIAFQVVFSISWQHQNLRVKASWSKVFSRVNQGRYGME